MKNILHASADIYRRDVELLQSGQWLNDSVINYCFRRLEIKYSNDFLFMDPSVVAFMRMQCVDCDEWRELAVGISISTRRWLLVPVNDNDSFDRTSNHWSLLLMFIPTGKCVHFDSHGSYNQKAALATAEKLYMLLERALDTVQVQHATRCPQQRNGYDCGVYVLLTADWLAQQLSSGTAGKDGTISNNDMSTMTADDEPALLRDLDHLCGRMAIEAVNHDRAEGFRQDMYTDIVRGRVINETFMVDRRI